MKLLNTVSKTCLLHSKWGLAESKEKTGCPLVVNTAFNVRGGPIICTPTDALEYFRGTEIDILAVGSSCFTKETKTWHLNNYKERYELD